jgi:hypothetical protein
MSADKDRGIRRQKQKRAKDQKKRARPTIGESVKASPATPTAKAQAA